MKSHTHLFVGVTSALLLSISSASASNGIQFSEFPLQETGFLGDCIQEEVLYDEWVLLRTHEFTTPSGVFHRLMSIEFVQTITGLSTGRTWFGQFHSSINTNVGPGSTFNVAVRGVADPVTGDGPKFLWKFDLKTTVTPDGDLVVSKGPEGVAKCIGRQ